MKHFPLSKTAKALSMAFIASVLPLNNALAADTNEESANSSDNVGGVIEKVDYLERIQIIGRGDKLRTEAGSATLIGETELEKFKFDDINRVLYNVPGVNIREEDGYGLRPNIGFRGATPERSKKNYRHGRWHFNWPCTLLSSSSLLFSYDVKNDITRSF